MRESVHHVKFILYNVMNHVHKVVNAKSKLKDTWRQSVELFGGEKRKERFVVCLYSNELAQDVMGEFFTCPVEC